MWRSFGLFLAALGITIQLSSAQSITWHPFEHALSRADSSGKYILVDVWAPWCGWCDKMKRSVYPALSTDLTQKWVFTQLNRDDNETFVLYRAKRFTPLRLAQRLGVQNVPAIILLKPDGTYLLHISGFTEAETVDLLLRYVQSGAYRYKTFSAFRNQKKS